MASLTIMPANKTVEVPDGTNLLKAIQDAGEPITTKCGGKASCGKCHVFLTGGRKGISRMTPEENAKLDTLVGVSSKSRLACQMTILGTEPVTVELLGALSG
jgi:2Fe-2S ferredoxin